MKKLFSFVLAFALLAGAGAAFAQLELPRPSPKASVMQQAGITEMTITYSRPGVKGRAIWGELVPWGEVWRTGANEATTITFSTPVTIAGTAVPAGTYGLFTIPGEKEWTVILNKAAKQWGAYEYKPEEDLLRFPVTPTAAPFTERLTFTFPNTTPDGTDVTLTWKELAVSFHVAVDVHSQVLDGARKAIAAAKEDDWRTPLRAATYCLDNGVGLDEARGWVERSLAVQASMGGLLAQARFAALDGDKAAAVKLARRAITVGKQADPKTDTTMVERFIKEWSQ